MTTVLLLKCRVGQEVELQATFKDATDALADPTPATIKVQHPSGTIEEFTGAALQHPSVGVFKLSFIPDKPGRWPVESIGSGAVQAVSSRASILVEPAL